MSTGAHHGPRLFSIPPAAPFLSTLADALLKGRLIPGFEPGDDPLALAGVTIYVPTRRAVRALQAEFVARSRENTLLLPRILALGDIEEEQFSFQPRADGALDLDPVIGSLERQLLLTAMIARWTDALNAGTPVPGEKIIVPSSISDAAWLANDLAILMDSVATEEANWSGLGSLVPEDHANWWQLTLAFLEIAVKVWPDLLRERGAMDMATRRGILLHRQAEHYREHGATGPVIAAGSTGSIPATAALLKVIARMENGAVVLPGLDRAMKDDVWDALETGSHRKIKEAQKRVSHSEAAAPGHPQYGLKKLLENIGALRGSVDHIGGIDDTSIGHARIREEIVSLSMEPSLATDNWPEIRASFSGEKSTRAFEGVALVEAPGERQEALAIAMALRETLQQPGQTAALVTPDRVLARRVSVELKRFGIEVDDSAGLPLADTPQGTLVKLLLAVTLMPGDPVALLALLKHPLAAFGMKRAEVRKAAETFEAGVLRGSITSPAIGEFRQTLVAAREGLEDTYRIAPSKSRLSNENWALAEQLAGEMDGVLATLFDLAGSTTQLALEQIVQATIETLEKVALDVESGLEALYGGEAGEALSSFLGELLVHGKSSATGIELKAREWPAFYEALLGMRPVRARRDIHPRLSIWGPLEARLQQVDRVVLGGLNEGTWPASTRNDPFLNRPMKSTLSLEPPERRIGLAAHDFQMMLGMNDVVITRAARADNAPTVSSRWLQRLLTLAGKDAGKMMHERGRKFLNWTEAIDRRDISRATVISRPQPKPPLASRPKKLSVTEIETWIRDPYAIYAKHVLKLVPLDPIIREADARERGTLYHAIMEEFSNSPADGNALARMLEIARRQFYQSGLPQEIAAFWWPRFEDIATQFVDWEMQRKGNVDDVHVELGARAEVGSDGFQISGRADRIDILNGGGAAIIDYKTGSGPSVKQANSLLAPQLPIEGAMLLRGAFEGIECTKVDQLTYVRLRPGDGFKAEELGRAKDFPEPQELSLRAWQALEALVAAYQDPDKGYISRARPFKQGDIGGDYDHLARVLEWSVGDEEAEGFE